MTELDIIEEKLQDVKGAVGSWEEFKYLTGVVAGLKGALEAVQDLKRQIEEA
jgi:Zn-finger domain-containing protein